MRAIIKHENEIIGTVQTNHSMSVEEAMELAGLNIDEMDGGDPKYNLDALTLGFESEV